MKTTLDNINPEGRNEIINQAIDYLKYNKPSCYGFNLHNEIYNQDYFIIGYYDSEQWLIKNIGIFAAIEEVKEYEINNFGILTTDISSSEKVVNMLVYIAGEEVLSMSDTLKDNWDTKLNEEDCDNIIKELENIL